MLSTPVRNGCSNLFVLVILSFDSIPFGKVRHNSKIELCLGCTYGALRVVLCTKISLLLPETSVRKKSKAFYQQNKQCYVFNKLSL